MFCGGWEEHGDAEEHVDVDVLERDTSQKRRHQGKRLSKRPHNVSWRPRSPRSHPLEVE